MLNVRKTFVFQAVSRFWRGEYSLVLTIIIFLFLLRLSFYIAQHYLLQPHSLVGTTLWIAAGSALLVWQVRGAYKAIEESLGYSGDMVSVYLCYLGMMLVFVVSLLQTADALAALNKSPDPAVITAKQGLRLLPVSKEHILLQGNLDFVSNQRLRATLEKNRNIKTVQLDSEGGRVFAARALAITIAHYGLNTHVESVCHSACTLVFIAGAKRTMAATAQLGFHRYKHKSKQPGRELSVDEQLVKDQQEFLRRGVRAEFVDKMFNSEADGLWLPAQQELKKAGVLHAAS